MYICTIDIIWLKNYMCSYSFLLLLFLLLILYPMSLADRGRDNKPYSLDNKVLK